MHIEILVEDGSGEKLLASLLPQLVGEYGAPHTWRLHSYKGIGRIPKGLKGTADPAKRILLDQLPRLLRGYGKTPGIDAVVVVLDTDKRDCADFLAELKAVADACDPLPTTLFRLAIEEVEAGISETGTRCWLHTPVPSRKCLIVTFRTACAAPGNCSPMPCIKAAQPRSRRRAGRCPGKSSTSGQRGLGR